MTREYISAVKSRYTKQQHQSIIEAYLFKRLPVEEIAANYGAGEMDITIILSSYRILLSCADKPSDIHTLSYVAERNDCAAIVGQYVDLYYNRDLADISPAAYFRNAKNEFEEASRQKQTIDDYTSKIIVEAKAKQNKKKSNIASVFVKIFAVLIFTALVITVPIYLYSNSIVQGDINSDIMIYVYHNADGFYGGQGSLEPSGLGRLITEDYVYIGQFSRGEMRGNGCFFAENRVAYIGGVNMGKRHGLGIEINRAEGAVLGLRKNGEPQGTVLKISENILELVEYSGGKTTTLAIGNYKEQNFNIKNSDYNINLSDGYYRLGKTSDINSKNGLIIEWPQIKDENIDNIIYYNEYKSGVLQRTLSYRENGDIAYVVRGFTITSSKDELVCSENDEIRNLSLLYSYRDDGKPLFFSKNESGTKIKLGTLLESGEIVL